MRALHWTIVSMAALGLVGIFAWLHNDGSQLSQPIMILRNSEATSQYSPEASNFRVNDRVSHNTFGRGTVIATNGPKLTIKFDEGGVKRVLDGFVVRGSEGAGKTGE